MMRILLLFILISTSASARLFIQPMVGYHSDGDDINDFKYSTTMLNLFVGGSLGRGDQWIIGQSIISSKRAEYDTASSNENEIALLEIGPRVQYFFSQLKNGYVAAVYNLYANGTRTLSGNEQEVEGTSMLFSLGYQLKMSKRVYLGFSFNYHKISISKQTQNNTASDVSHEYTIMYPGFEVSYRF